MDELEYLKKENEGLKCERDHFKDAITEALYAYEVFDREGKKNDDSWLSILREAINSTL
jgi:hypothetical protein